MPWSRPVVLCSTRLKTYRGDSLHAPTLSAVCAPWRRDQPTNVDLVLEPTDRARPEKIGQGNHRALIRSYIVSAAALCDLHLTALDDAGMCFCDCGHFQIPDVRRGKSERSIAFGMAESRRNAAA